MLAQIAESVKKLTDKTGHIVPMLMGGDFDLLAFRMPRISILSNINCSTNYLHCVVDKRQVTLAMIQRDLAKVSNEKLAAVKTFHLFYEYYPPQRNFQPFIDTIVEVMPNVKNVVLILNLIDLEVGLQN
uniref:Asparagine synthetase domain-containing protein n=1 Tax=Panagrellus redivivus TaxID=6233 RepID=A0A7E4UXY9_PANRE